MKSGYTAGRNLEIPSRQEIGRVKPEYGFSYSVHPIGAFSHR